MGEIHRLPGGRFPKTYGDERHEALLGTPPPGRQSCGSGVPRYRAVESQTWKGLQT